MLPVLLHLRIGIGQMRAARFDQLQRLLARYSVSEIRDPQKLSVSRTARIVERWARAKYALYRHVYVKQPGWISLTKKGLALRETHATYLSYNPHLK